MRLLLFTAQSKHKNVSKAYRGPAIIISWLGRQQHPKHCCDVVTMEAQGLSVEAHGLSSTVSLVKDLASVSVLDRAWRSISCVTSLLA